MLVGYMDLTASQAIEILTIHVMWKSPPKPNLLTPFPTRKGGNSKSFSLKEERNRSEVFQMPRIHLRKRIFSELSKL